VDAEPSLAELVGLLAVPVQVEVPLVVHLEHALADAARLLQLVLHVVEHLLLLVDLRPPMLGTTIRQ